MYFGLIVIGLLIGGGFLAFLLIGDWRAARRQGPGMTGSDEADSKQAGVWPPPPRRVEVSPPLAPAVTRSTYGVWISNPVMRAFYRLRYAAFGVVLLAYLISDSYPALSFGGTLAAAAAGYAAFTGLLALWKRRRARVTAPERAASRPDSIAETE